MPTGKSPQDAGVIQTSKLEAILESAVDSIVAIDADGIIVSANPATEELFQYPRRELVGRNISMLMPEPYRAAHDGYIRRYLDTGQRKIIGIGREVIGQRKDGSTFPMHLSVGEFQVEGRRYFTGIIRDLTQRERAEQALRQSQKMEAIGQLTGGVAHDFNNLLTVIVGNLELLDVSITDEGQRALLKEALEAADLGARLTDRLLTFARRRHLAPELINLNSSVLGLTHLLRRTLGEPVDFSTVLSPDLWHVRVDRSQLESAIVNLAVNARDAMPRGGKLVVETKNVIIEDDYGLSEFGLAAGEYARLAVSDSGHGMPPEIRDRVFEPFFTTKDAGQGTGLGLSMVYGFARQSGGMATIYSEVGKGTVVNIYLPREASESEKAKTGAAPVEARNPEGKLILVVEDDERVRRLSVARLRQLGYRVLEAGTGREALEMVHENPSVDLVFTDLVMPGGMTGYELCEAVRQMKPDIRCLLTSGYSEDLLNNEKLRELDLMVLRKPYRQAELVTHINAVFGGS